jgi:hypothetical protein
VIAEKLNFQILVSQHVGDVTACLSRNEKTPAYGHDWKQHVVIVVVFFIMIIVNIIITQKNLTDFAALCKIFRPN